MKKKFILQEPCCPNCDSMDATLSVYEDALIPILSDSKLLLVYICPYCGEIIYLEKEKLNQIPNEVMSRVVNKNKNCANELIKLIRLNIELRSLKDTYNKVDKECKKLQKVINFKRKVN